MKILQYEEYNGRVLVTVLYEDNTFTALNMLNTGNKDEILKDVYIVSSDVRNRQPFEGEIPTDLETYEKPQSVATKLTNVDFHNFTADVYDQFGDRMDTDVTFEIEGTDKARIEDNKIVEDVVDTDTSYFIVAKCGELEQRQERFLYAPREEPKPTEIDLLNARIQELESTIAIMLGVD